MYYISYEKYCEYSIELLKDSGVNFNMHKSDGIPQDLFAEYLITSGLILNTEITWICFHGIFDFAYLLKYATNDFLPLDQQNFQQALQIYFPSFYDIKTLSNSWEKLRGGLSKLASMLNVFFMINLNYHIIKIRLIELVHNIKLEAIVY